MTIGPGEVVVPQRPPTCWEFFGLVGPTNRHNLDGKYQELINNVTPARYENAMFACHIFEQYQQCLKELGEAR